MLIPLFYYLSNPFLHRMTNFIPTAAPIFPRSCSFPKQPGRLSTHLHLPPPSCRFRTLLNPRAGHRTSTLCPCPTRDTAKSSRTARREPTWHHREGGNEPLICKKTNPTLLSSDLVFCFPAVAGNFQRLEGNKCFYFFVPAGRRTELASSREANPLLQGKAGVESRDLNGGKRACTNRNPQKPNPPPVPLSDF